jgi:hypothetical protein
MTSITVRQLWVKFSKEFGRNLDTNIANFYRDLGTNIPRYLVYEGEGIQYIFCVKPELDVNAVCARYPISRYSTSEFITEEARFNSKHQIQPTYDKREFELSEHIIG